MSYQLNRTDGTILTNLVDGQIDEFSTDLTLVGRSYSGYGEYYNENVIHLLENFANTVPPETPMTGQLWWNTAMNQMEVYIGDSWTPVGRPYVNDTRPFLRSGDIWFDTSRKQMFINDGVTDTLIGPAFTDEQEKSGFIIEDIRDEVDADRTIASIYSSGDLIGIVSNIEFNPDPQGFFSDYAPIRKGLNLVDGSILWGTVEKAQTITDGTTDFTSDDFIKQGEAATLRSVVINGDPEDSSDPRSGKLYFGVDQSISFSKIQNENLVIDSLQGLDIVTGSEDSSGSLVFRAGSGTVEILTSPAGGELTVGGNSIFQGNFRVADSSGEAVFDVPTFQTQATLLELGLTNGSPLSSGSDQASGISVRVDDGDRNLVWNETSGLDAWESNIDFSIAMGKAYMIDGQQVLTATSLLNVNNAPDLNTIGDLNRLTVGDLDIDNSTIASQNTITIEPRTGLEVSTLGNIDISANFITVDSTIRGLHPPSDPSDAVNKQYVDENYNIQDLAFAIDATGVEYVDGVFVGGTMEVIVEYVQGFLTQLVPATEDMVGRKANIHVSRFISDDELNNPSEMPEYDYVNTGVVFQSPNGEITLNIARMMLRFVVDGTPQWVWTDDVFDSVGAL